MHRTPVRVSFDQLTRPQVSARIATLRRTLDFLMELTDRDGGPTFECVGRMKVTLIGLERHLYAMDQVNV